MPFSFFSRFVRRSNQPSRNHRNKNQPAIPRLESLESRTVLSTAKPNLYWIYTRQDVVDQPNEAVQVALPLTNDRIKSTPSGRTLFEIRISPAPGSSFVPGSMLLTGPNGLPIDLNVLRRGKDLFALAHLENGNYEVTVRGRGTAQGAFLVRTYLTGDVNGDRAIDGADLRAFQARTGHRDVNRDGRITARDRQLIQINRAAEVTTIPIKVSNNTGLTGQAGQVYFTVYGADLGSNGSTQLDQWYLDSNQQKQTISGSITSVPSFSLANFPNGVELPLPDPTSTSSPIANGRVYFGVGGAVQALIQGGTVTAPTPGDGLNDQTYYDFLEFALQNGSINGGPQLQNLNVDTSQVDQFGLNVRVHLVDTSNNKTPTVGIVPSLTRDQLVQRYSQFGPIQGDYLPATVFTVDGNTYRLLNPSDAITMSLKQVAAPGTTISNVVSQPGGGTTATATLTSNTLNLFAGMSVTGTGIPSGTTIQSVSGSNALTLVSTGTLTATTADLTFAGQPTPLLNFFDDVLTETFNYYTPTAQGGGGNTLTFSALSNSTPTLFTGTVNTSYKLGGTAVADVENDTQYVSIVTLTTGDTTQLQPNYEVFSNGVLLGTINSILSNTEIAVISSTPVAASTGDAITFSGSGAPSGSFTGDVAASTLANQTATFTYSTLVSGSLDDLIPGMVVTGPGVYTPATTVYSIDTVNNTITLYSPLPISTENAVNLIFTNPVTGTQVQLTGDIGNVQQLYAYEVTLEAGSTTTGLYQGMTVAGGNFPAGTFVSSISTSSNTVLNMLSTGDVANANDVSLSFTWNNSQGVEQEYVVFEFTDGTDTYRIFEPFFSTNTGDSSKPLPPPWLSNTTITASTMVFACNGVFADNVGQYPSDANASTVLGALENQLVSALNRGVATTLVSRQGEILPGDIGPDGFSATLTITDPLGTTGLVPGMAVAGPGTSGGLRIKPGSTIGPNSVTVVSTQTILPFNPQELTFSQPYAAGGTWNAWAAFFHQPTVTIDGKAYGFAFDDQGGNSTDISINNPQYGSLVLGPWS